MTPMSGTLPAVELNPWLACAVGLTLRLWLPGLAWLPFVDGLWAEGRGRWERMAAAGAAALTLGLAAVTLLRLLAAEAGWAGRAGEWAAWAAITGLGLALSLWRARGRLREAAASCAPAAGTVCAAWMAAMLLPRAGEWFLGGWDPGVYVNQGYALSRTGTFHPPTPELWHRLTAEELTAFTRGETKYLEAFPGVPLDPRTRAIEPYFFRLMPAWVSVLADHGGLRAAVRVNLFGGVAALFVFLAFVRAAGSPWRHALAAAALLAVHPIWLYHLHVPISEMLELWLLAGIGLLAAVRGRGALAPVALGGLCFAGVAARFSFLPFGALAVAGLAWADVEREQRGRVALERALQTAGLLAGGWYDAVYSAASFSRRHMDRTTGLLWGAAAAALAAAWVLEALAAGRGWRRRLTALPRWVAPLLWLAGSALLAGVLAGVAPRWLAPVTHRARQLAPFAGYALLALAWGGAWLFWTDEGGPSRLLRALTLVMLGVGGLLLVNDFMIGIYPWALRRHLSFTVPALAILAAYAAERAAQRWGAAARGGGAAILGAALLLAAGANLKRSWRAWARRDYDGISAALAQAASRVAADELVVADHPWWGTPLLLVYGKQALNGKELFDGPDPGAAQRGLAALGRLRDAGVRVRFLTSTAPGLDGCGWALEPPPVLDWSSGPLVMEEVIHSRRAADFAARQRRPVLRLYTWPAPRPSG